MKAIFLGLIGALCLTVAMGCDDEETVVGTTSATLFVLDTVVTADEGQDISFLVALDAAVNRVVTFEYTVTGVTADSGADFAVSAARDSLLPFVTQKVITVLAVDDSDLEPGADEEFTFAITSVTNAQLGSNSSAVGKIGDNDAIFFTSDIQPMLFDLKCGTGFCHGSFIKSAGIFIGDSTYYAQNPGVSMYDTLLAQSGSNGQLIIPNNADSSTLYQSVLPSPSYGGDQMKGSDGNPLTATQITRLRNWINQGAPLN